MKLSLKVLNVDRRSIDLEWNKPQDILKPLFKLTMNENNQNSVIIYRGFHNYFCVKNLSGSHLYKFNLQIELHNVSSENSVLDTATVSLTTKSECPSITAFHHSAYQNLPLLFQEFLDTRAHDINIYNELGECSLSKACAAGHNDMVLTLLQYGADVNLPNLFTRITPLMTAAYHGHGDIIRILARNDADFTLKDINLKTALHYAVDGSHNDAVKMLLEGNWGDVNSVDSKGWTPLMRAVLMFANLDVIKTLISHGSDLSTKDKNGQDIWQLAHLSNNLKALEILPN
ncbi:fibronectin type 3 and ankyrin repeat domains protein 1-like isoform X2 [Melanaphis sacchari]|uniref:fibronectin type 3 and ankyrin repeat domains protein 1-like isoform X2 n=1 Tax=Melanaphis sacchari TaxID=742174 RepID=UPI000DC13DF2|nr:fibronectin type 3 and ankyrin repeat domains protein 1-like isoform X2 [Melanaphis sacchari]